MHETADFLAIRDVNPQAPVHVLIVPKRVIPRIAEAEAGDAALLGQMLLAAREIARKSAGWWKAATGWSSTTGATPANRCRTCTSTSLADAPCSGRRVKRMISERFQLPADRTLRRVVITGMGIVAPNGKDVEDLLGFDPRRPQRRRSPSRASIMRGRPVPARLRDHPISMRADYMDAKAANRLERSLQFGIAAARMAVTDAGIDFNEIDPDRTGIVEATSLSNQDALEKGSRAFDERGHRAITPSMVISGYVGSGSAEIATQIGCEGHAITCSSSSASGNDVMGYALSMIQNEDVDVMVAGGAEAPIFETGYAGFAHSRAMTRWHGAPTEAMKPFDQAGDGFVMGEGGAYVVLEELSHALSPRGPDLRRMSWRHGRSCEAYHAMAPHPDGAGLVRAMEKAFPERPACSPPRSTTSTSTARPTRTTTSPRPGRSRPSSERTPGNCRSAPRNRSPAIF